MAKTVVSTQMVVHLWAAQTQTEARTSSNSMSFASSALYSYAMQIGNIVQCDNICVILLNASARNRSITTCQHFSHALMATKQFVHNYIVPHINPCYDPKGYKHKENIEFLVTQYRVAVDKMLKSLKSDYWNSSGRKALEIKLGEVNGYCLIFDQQAPVIDYNADCDKIDARFIRLAALASDPKKVAARAKREAKRLAAQAEQERLGALTQLEKLTAWLQGANVKLPYVGFRTPKGGAYLRVMGKTLETSLGAEVPLAEAVELFKIVDRLLSSITMVADYTIGRRVGAFTVDCVCPNGDIKAGCHLIERAESVRIAKQLGLELSFFDNVTRAIVHGN